MEKRVLQIEIFLQSTAMIQLSDQYSSVCVGVGVCA